MIQIVDQPMTEDDAFDCLCTSGDVAQRCGVSMVTARKWIDQNLLESVRIPGSNHRRVRLSVLLTFMQVSGLAKS